MSVLAELIAVLQTDRGFKNTALDFTTPLTQTHTCDFSQQRLALRACDAFVVYLILLYPKFLPKFSLTSLQLGKCTISL